MTVKQLISLASSVSLGVILGAYYFEYIGGFAPCKLCYWQRYPHFLNILIFPIFYLLQKRALIFIGLMSMLTSTVLAFYHVGVEKKYWLGPNSCTNSSIEGLTTDQLLTQIMNAPLVRCDEIAWEFIGVSMAGWNVLISFSLFLTWIYCYLKIKNK
jgi:disulfide bond formation protein DsbB